jgi:1-acyl-sn-glycerol-3-phosphate acyltransferase
MNPLWKLRIEDKYKFDDKKRYIIISNHQSLVDIVVIYSLFKHFRWTSKTENFKLPFVGWVLSINRSVRVYRNNPEAYQLFQEKAAKAFEEGNSLMIFPEGTRSRTGDLGRFKDGAFRLAHDLKADILPAVLDGSARAIPKSGWSLKRRVRMIFKVLDPIPYSDFAKMTVKETRAKFHSLIEDELEKIRNNS